MAQALTQNFAVPGDVVVVPNGRSLGGPQDTPRLQAVTAGRVWDEAKNIGVLRDVRSPIPIFVAGEMQQGSVRAPAELPHQMLLGPLSQEELLALFRKSAIYICTSHYEPFGLAPLEAALCGCAVICNDIPSLHEVWGDSALYFRDAATLSALLRWLSDNPDELSSAQQRAVARARIFSAERMTESYMGLYRKALTQQEKPAYVA
jgi:glycogen synthase